MYPAIGSVFLASAIILFSWTYGQYRRPNPSPWTQSEWVAVSFTLFIILLFTLGVGSVITVLSSIHSLTTGALEVAIIVGLNAVAFALVPSLTKPARMANTDAAGKSSGAASVTGIPLPTHDPRPTTPKRPSGRSGKSARRLPRAA